MKNGTSKGNGRTRADNPPEPRILHPSEGLENAQNRRLIRRKASMSSKGKKREQGK